MAIYHAESPEAFVRGEVGTIAVSDIVQSDHVHGQISFQVDGLSVFSIGAPVPCGTDSERSTCFLAVVGPPQGARACLALVWLLLAACVVLAAHKQNTERGGSR